MGDSTDGDLDFFFFFFFIYNVKIYAVDGRVIRKFGPLDLEFCRLGVEEDTRWMESFKSEWKLRKMPQGN